MKWLDRMKLAYRAITLSDFPQLAVYLNDNQVAPGITVNEGTALTNAAFWNGVNIISSQIATLPRAVYRRLNDDDRVREKSQPASRLMFRPNEHMTDVVFWETLVAHAITWGNGYAEIEFDRALRPIALWPITPNRVVPILDGGRLRYRLDGGQKILEPEDVIHIKNLGDNGLVGHSTVEKARRSLGLSMAAERFGASFFANGARPGVILSHPKALTPSAQQRLKDTFGRANGGDRQLGVEVVEEGMTVTSIGIPPDDAQFLETREFQIEEVARWLNISPSKLKSKVGERPGGNLEADQIIFLTDTLRPWLIRIEQELDRKLFPVSQQGTFYIEHNVEAILRVDNAARMAGYKSLFEMGVLSAKQIARKENLPEPEEPEPEPIPVNVLPPTPPLALPPPSQDSERMAAALRSVLVDQVARFVRKEADRATKAAKKGPQVFSTWLDEFYDSEAVVLRELILTGVELHMAHAGVSGDSAEVSDRLAAAYVQRSKDQLASVKVTNLEREVEGVVERWQTLRPTEMADAIAAMKENVNAA